MTGRRSAALTRWWPRIWALFVGTSAFYFLSANTADNDLWIHVRTGLDIIATHSVPRVDSSSYTVTGAPWIDHEWLLHALLGSVYRRAGSAGLLLFKLIVAAGTFGLLAHLVARRARSAHVRGVVLLVALPVIARGFAIRPQILTYLGVVLLLAALNLPARWRVWVALGLPLLIALWANLHGAVLLGIGILGLCAAWNAASERPWALALGASTIAGAALGLLVNPYGTAFAQYLWRELSAPHPITEWQPVALEWSQATFFLLATAFAATLPWATDWRRRGWEVLVALAALAMALQHRRHTPAFALCAAPVLAANLEQALARWRWPARRRLSGAAQRVVAIAIVAIAVLQLSAAGSRLFRDRFRVVFDPREYPVGAVAFLQRAKVQANLAVPLDWGAYVLWHAAPQVKVSLDGRFATVYPPAVVEANFAFFSGRDHWRQLIDKYPTDAVLAPAPALLPIADSSRWRRVYGDRVAVIFARRGTDLDRLTRAEPAAAEMPAGATVPFP